MTLVDVAPTATNRPSPVISRASSDVRTALRRNEVQRNARLVAHDPGVVPRADLPVDEIIPIADTVVVRSDPQAATA